ncbi:unnamed protein product [Calypogeia fissa]
MWGELVAILEVDTFDMTYVEESEDWQLKQFEAAKNTLSKSTMKIDSIVKLRVQYLEWKGKDAKLSIERLARTEEEYKILSARKKEAHALHQLTVYHIAYDSLAHFRQFHENQPQFVLEVNQGGELAAIRSMCQQVISDNVIFGNFIIVYTTIGSGCAIREDKACDAGRLTDHLLTQAWSALFNTSGEFHSVFEKGDSTNHLSTADPDISPQQQSDIILVGQLMFLIALKQQRMTRETTMATLAMAMGKVPDRVSIRQTLENNQENIYVEDYKQFRLNEFTLMNLLLKGGIDNATETYNWFIDCKHDR